MHLPVCSICIAATHAIELPREKLYVNTHTRYTPHIKGTNCWLVWFACLRTSARATPTDLLSLPVDFFRIDVATTCPDLSSPCSSLHMAWRPGLGPLISYLIHHTTQAIQTSSPTSTACHSATHELASARDREIIRGPHLLCSEQMEAAYAPAPSRR